MNDSVRHLKRLFLQNQILPDDVINVIKTAPVVTETKKEKKSKRQVFGITPENELIKNFSYNTIRIPSVHPVPAYFDMALRQTNYLSKQKGEILKSARANDDIQRCLDLMFLYFGTASIFASQLAASIECFSNLQIRPNSKYQRKRNSTHVKGKSSTIKNIIQFFKRKKTKELVGNDITWVPLKEKIEFLIPELTGKNDFEIENPKALSIIKNLIDFRNACIHPTKDKEYSMDNYENLFNSCLSFKYNKTIEAVKSYINYYSDSPIINECFCNKKQ